MKDLLPTIFRWTESNIPFVIATVVKTWGSSPRPVGSSMIVNMDKEMAGSVSGGCVEGAVVKEAINLLDSGGGKQLNYGVTDDDAWAVGLSCGGKIQVYIDNFSSMSNVEVRSGLLEHLSKNRGCVLITSMVDGVNSHTLRRSSGEYIGDQMSETVINQAESAYRERRSMVAEDEGTSYFIHVFPRRSQMLVIGAAHVTTHLVELAAMYDFETIVIDPRGAFASKTQFSVEPDKVIEAYPAEVLDDFDLDAYTYAVILSHDPKIDDNALHVLLPSETAYIGALGSKKTHAKRVARLTDAGFTEEQLARIYAPIGASINAKSPKEIALSIMAQVIEVKNQFK